MTRPVEKLEREFAARLGVLGAVATGFGRSALRLALEAVGCGAADVLVPDFICAQVPEAVRLAGARPVFYRVPRDLTIRPAALAETLTAATKLAVVPHYFGRVQAHVRELAEWCRERNALLLEDCALALGAKLGGRDAGSFGDLGIFSFTKGDWCYGGGLLVANDEEALERARVIRKERFVRSEKFALLYGRLRRADFACNRPRHTAAAERTGRRLQQRAGLGDGNFYDAGRFDTKMPGFTARRAAGILRALDGDSRRRRKIVEALTEKLGDAPHILFDRESDAGSSGAFVLLHSRAGRAREWVEQAARERVTLRHVWPAYQEPEPGQGSETLKWLAEHLLVLEIHPALTESEVNEIARCLRRLAAKE